ncbi:hypothetical protein FRB99_000074 [Tulasnella sp. 403]|nr:hypothetical protein FRB99_000074 [Tulasnella sp. 403]
MIGRAVSPRSILTLGASSVALSIAYHSGPVYAEEVSPAPVRQKLSIYPKPDPEIQLAPTESKLADKVGEVRENAQIAWSKTRSEAQSVLEKWIGVEQVVERKLKELAPEDEPLLPGLMYVGVATLTGSVIGRHRGLVTRLALPPALLALSLAYCLPKTAHNISGFLGSLEARYLPNVATRHAELNQVVHDTVKTASKTYSETKDTVSAKIQDTRRDVENKTGLKLGTTLEGERKDKD